MRNAASLVFQKEQPRIGVLDADCVIIASANRGGERHFSCRNRPVLYALNGRVC